MFFQDKAALREHGLSDWVARFTAHRLAMMAIIGLFFSSQATFETGRYARGCFCIQLAL